MSDIEIRYARYDDFSSVRDFLDDNFTREGYGFLHSGQIETEIKKSRVLVAVMDGVIIGCRVGTGKLWNISVKKEFRGLGVGGRLLNAYRPDVIRVKSDPIGHLSIAQKDGFVNPEPFYEKHGYKYFGSDFGRNFYQNASGKAQYHRQGEKRHIKIYVKNEEEFLFNDCAEDSK